MRDDDEWIESVRDRSAAAGDGGEDILELLDLIERGFDDIEHRIANMDKEHSKYVRATVTRSQRRDRYEGADCPAPEPDLGRRQEGRAAQEDRREDESVPSGDPL